MRNLLATALILLAAGCGSDYAPPSQVTEGESEASSETGMGFEEVDLYVFPSKQTVGVENLPLFHLHVGKLAVPEDNRYEFTDAEATVYGAAEEEPLRFKAPEGHYEQGLRARLGGGVEGHSGTMSFFMEEVTWEKQEEDDTGIVHSDHPVTIKDTGLHLDAKSLTMFPEQNKVILKNVSGTIDLEEKSE